jgi:hypothetical protein
MTELGGGILCSSPDSHSARFGVECSAYDMQQLEIGECPNDIVQSSTLGRSIVHTIQFVLRYCLP